MTGPGAFLHLRGASTASTSSTRLRLPSVICRIVLRFLSITCHGWCSVAVEVCRHRVEVLDDRALAIGWALAATACHGGLVVLIRRLMVVCQGRFSL